MNRRMICRVLGLILLCLAALLLLPMVAGLCYGESVSHFLITIAISGTAGFLLTRIRPYSTVIYAKDGFVVVSLGWILMSMLGALPFVIPIISTPCLKPSPASPPPVPPSWMI